MSDLNPAQGTHVWIKSERTVPCFSHFFKQQLWKGRKLQDSPGSCSWGEGRGVVRGWGNELMRRWTPVLGSLMQGKWLMIDNELPAEHNWTQPRRPGNLVERLGHQGRQLSLLQRQGGLSFHWGACQNFMKEPQRKSKQLYIGSTT